MDPNKVVIIIEDEKDLLDSYTEVVESTGATVYGATDGYKGLKLIEENKTSVAVVLLDLMMPGIDGIEVLRQIKSHPDQYDGVPVVILTNMVSDKVVKECLTLGASEYYVKTEISSDELITNIQKYLSSK